MAPGPRKAAAPNQQHQPQPSDDDLPPDTALPTFPQPVSSLRQLQRQQYQEFAASSPFAPAAAGAAPFPAAAGGGMLPISSSAASYMVPSSQQLLLQHQQQRPWEAAVLLPGSAATLPAGSMLDASAPAGAAAAAAAAPFGYTVGGLPLPYGTPGSSGTLNSLAACTCSADACTFATQHAGTHSLCCMGHGPLRWSPLMCALSTCRVVGAAQARPGTHGLPHPHPHPVTQ